MPRQILIVDDDAEILAGLSLLLSHLEWDVVTASSGREALRQFDASSPDVVLLDVMLPDLSGIEVLEQLKSYAESIPVVMMSGVGTIDMAVEAMRRGAEHFIPKPYDIDALEMVLEQASRTSALHRQLEALRRSRPAVPGILVGVSPQIAQLNELIPKISRAPSPVLLLGESGTGKGVLGRLIHDSSPRARGPYVDLNCAGLSRELLESELFGHERGAFTGAHVAKPGLFEIAAGGTLFLDEIGELEPALQARLLKVLEEKKFRRVGGVRDIHVDVRLLAATNRNVEKEVAENRFRADLYYRLNVVSIVLPPLRDRIVDIPLLSEVILTRLASELGMKPRRVSARAMRKLAEYSWPGNIRELRNALERAMLVCEGEEIRPDDLPLTGDKALLSGPDRDRLPSSEWEIQPLEDVISLYVRASVEAAGGNIRKAARGLNISPSTLYARLKKLDPNTKT